MNHQILLQKLHYYGIRNNSLLWFKSYLSNRTQYTEIGDVLSDVGFINCGVPQGSVLGPLLFLLYINDITESSQILKFFLFADDTTLFYSDKTNPETENLLNTELSKVSDWLAANKLSLNVDKSNFMHFHFGKKKKITLNISLDDRSVTEKTVTKYLGTLIDNKLNWKQHIQHIHSKLSKAIGIISKVRYYAPQNIPIKLYHSFVQSHIDYNILNWSSTPSTNLECIRLKIKKAIRIITFKNKYEHTCNLFKELKLLPLDTVIKHKQAVFMWKLQNGTIPSPISDMFTLNRTVIVNRTNPLKYNLPNPNNEYEKKSISYSCVNVWNAIPAEFKQINNLKLFTGKYRSYLINI